VNPLSPARKPIEANVGARNAKSTPAAPARAEPRTNANTITRSMSIPIMAAASRSYEVACIALPVFVLVTSTQSTAIRTNALEMITIRSSGTRTLPTSNPSRNSTPFPSENAS
jgi:hypothetical protein